MARSMAKESKRTPTAQGVSLVFKTHYFSSIRNLISSFRYEGAFKEDEKHDQGIETFSDGSRYFSPLKLISSHPPLCEFNFFF